MSALEYFDGFLRAILAALVLVGCIIAFWGAAWYFFLRKIQFLQEILFGGPSEALSPSSKQEQAEEELRRAQRHEAFSLDSPAPQQAPLDLSHLSRSFSGDDDDDVAELVDVADDIDEHLRQRAAKASSTRAATVEQKGSVK